MAGINYAEERAYWYLRLNGFFLLTDYVVHKSLPENDCEGGIEYHRDVDLIGIRFPNVYEEIGGQENDFDTDFLNKCGINTTSDAPNRTIAVICEVKSGAKFDKKKLNIAMENERTKSAIGVAVNRLGICTKCEVSENLNHFSSKKSAIFGDCVVRKILFSKENSTTNLSEKPYYIVTLDYARNFILKRLNKYLDPKYASRFFFNSIMMQEYSDLIYTLRKNHSQIKVETLIDNYYI